MNLCIKSFEKKTKIKSNSKIFLKSKNQFCPITSKLTTKNGKISKKSKTIASNMC